MTQLMVWCGSEDAVVIYTDVAFVTAPDLEFVKAVCEGEEVVL